MDEDRRLRHFQCSLARVMFWRRPFCRAAKLLEV